MRVLTKQKASDGLPNPLVNYTWDDACEYGMVFQHPMIAPYNCTWDKQDGYLGRVHCDWIGEDEAGVYIHVHPRIALLAMPELWGPVATMQMGRCEVYESDLLLLSAFEYQCKLEMVAAVNRVQKVGG